MHSGVSEHIPDIHWKNSKKYNHVSQSATTIFSFLGFLSLFDFAYNYTSFRC